MADGTAKSTARAAGEPRTTPRRYVVVGAGAAGVIAAETLRRTDPAGDIVLVNGENEQPYARMAIPYVLTGKIPTEERTCGRRPITTSASASASPARSRGARHACRGRSACRTAPRCPLTGC